VLKKKISSIQMKIDGQSVSVPEGTTILEAATDAGISIPTLCYHPKLNSVGVCRFCVVDVGERVLAASCTRTCQEGMDVQTDSKNIKKYRKCLTEMLLADHPVPCEKEKTTGDCELEELGREYGILSGEGGQTKFRDENQSLLLNQKSAEPEKSDLSSPVIAVDHHACILCDRCIRACDDLQCNDIIGRSGKGYSSSIGFDLNQPMGESQCVTCGECVSACPTGALTQKTITLPVISRDDLEQVDSVCPYCGVGCSLTYHKIENKIVFAEGRESPVNHGRLCVKGRYGWDYTFHSQRLTKPLIRRDSHYPKGPLSPEVAKSQSGQNKKSGKNKKPGGIVDYDQVMPAFREAEWDEVLDLIADKFLKIKKEFSPSSLAGFGSAKCSNEEAYLFQKLIRAGFGTNNVDHCTRLCHASSVAALMETIGSGAVTNVFADVTESDLILITGSNSSANHPVAASFFKEAARKNAKLIVVDVREHEMASQADHFACIKPGSDVAFYNGVMHVLIRDDLVDQKFIDERTEGFEELKKLVLKDYSPGQVEEICGVSAEIIETIARAIGKSKNMLIFWGMGISQHVTGTDNARCLISLCLMTGSVGRPGTGLHPLRGQNNVQGASDAGLIPIVYPDYQPVGITEIREKFEQAWECELDHDAGLTVVEIMAGALDSSIRGMYILGENPFISDPNINKVRMALSNLDFLVIQDIFLTETAEFADVILPATTYFEKTGTYTNTDRRVQMGRKVVDPPGEAKEDWKVICEIGNRIGISMNYDSSSEVFDEFTSLTKNYHGLSHDNLGATGKLWPCDNPEEGDGTRILFDQQFPTETGLGKFVPCPYLPPDESTDEEFEFVLSTGRLLEHWHTGTMTRRSYALNEIASTPYAYFHPDDLKRRDLKDEQFVEISSRRGTIEIQVKADQSIRRGVVFIPFHFRESPANVLTNDALDPFVKIPEFKVCAVKVKPLEKLAH
jgi:formate dehydrogenase major subunit